NRSAQRWAPVSASISWVLTRTLLPDCLILPSSRYRTPNSWPICLASPGLFRKVNALLREMTNKSGSRDKSVVRSSVTPSARYCWSGSLLRLANGSTTMDRRGATRGWAPKDRGGCCDRGRWGGNSSRDWPDSPRDDGDDEHCRNSRPSHPKSNAA